ncbi:NUDIX domain-containing protein (plasmid) [Streptomyces sp. BI20]|uniref:NUDIX domain-containing protein n=1 Tax=Streptomyces sp. BI20 TaxID=3403460 RepID=UPI003C744221
MKERVRAVLVTPARTMLAIRRTVPGRGVYHVLVGGGVEDGDPTPEAALHREIHEEIAGEARIVRLLGTLTDTERDEVQHIYLAEARAWSFDDRTGPEFARTDRGTYELAEVPFTPQALAALGLQPPTAVPLIENAMAEQTV